ncbi:hypothetical protein K461DRAFT_226255 [Myriangium duriaei CBS 260.36]|uniref:WIBG Mago-binding domain-containing protein n=1 Tax=Myriangium duriaei CBS 260.36 TaxID=1168546 RepID=A0A9P4J3Q3_9PEZI|nr:hypothetical protein K461DRAFT_226255 [Myriangium duriaei CBS 260.36]
MAPSVETSKAGVSRSGIAEGKDGQRHIPSSVRADGSVRKEIRIRDGYRPPEDVEVYKNRTAEAWKNRGKGGVPGAEAVGEEASSASSNKNAKRREARKKAAAAATTSETTESPANPPQEAAPAEPIDPEAEKAKEARKLSKKLRQARELKDKKDKGDSLLPEQFEKVIKINELIRQLDKLGFDADGEKKAAPV